MVKKKVGIPPYRYEERIRTDDFEDIIYKKDGPVGYLIINKPEKRNCLAYTTLTELAMGLHEMDVDPEVRVIVIKGAGSAYCSGYDLTPGKAAVDNPNLEGDPRRHLGYADVGDPPGGIFYTHEVDMAAFAKYEWFGREVYWRMWDLHKPVISQIHGYCLAGGTHLAGFSDLRVVADDAQIGFPVVRQLTSQGFQYEVWLMGLSKAKHYLFTGDPMTGQEAFDNGWASSVFPADKLEEETDKLAHRIAQTDPVLLMKVKMAMHRQLEVQGFRTGMRASMDVHMTGIGGYGESFEFFQRSSEDGLRSALDWRDDNFGIEYNAPTH